METLAATQNELSDQDRERQIYIDLLTQFSELVDGNMRTDFDLELAGDDLIGEDGRGLDKITKDALDEAKQIALGTPELSGEPRRRRHEREEFEQVLAMAKGEGTNTLIVISDFPQELMKATKDVGGYNVSRKQTMLRVFIRPPVGRIRMFSQTLDGSNRQALEAIYKNYNQIPEQGELLGQRIPVELNPYEQENVVNQAVGVHDTNLADQFGGEWYAGRRPGDIRNTYEFVSRQYDLIEACVKLQKDNLLDDRTMYDVAATMQKRFDLEQRGNISTAPREQVVNLHAFYHEIQIIGDEARWEGKSFSGCGVTLRPDGTDGSTENNLELAGYGNKSNTADCEFISKECPMCHAKNVKTTSKRRNGKLHVEGECGCKKSYNASSADE